MQLVKSLPLLLALTACATARLGDKTIEAELKKLAPVRDKVSLYVCRPDAVAGSAVGAEAFVNGRSIGALKVNTFAHVLLDPGKAKIFLRRNGIGANSGDSGILELEGSTGEVSIVWAGQAGFIGPVTVDQFNSRAEAESCVRSAEYAVP